MTRKKVLELKDVSVAYEDILAVQNVSFSVYKGETFGLVGGSGSGKSTIAKTITGIKNPQSGTVLFKGNDVFQLNKKKERLQLNKKLQMIFQDSYSSLNPRMKIGDSIKEGIEIHNITNNNKEAKNLVYTLLNLVGLDPQFASRYPHEFSGGQRQRVGIARALAVNPECLIADEPISGLDVSIQAKIINLLNDLKEELDLTYLFIAHDLQMVRYFCDRVGIMNKGHLIELGSVEEIYENPAHSYTKSLLTATPLMDPEKEKNREMFYFDEKAVDYTGGTWKKVSEDHYVLAQK